MDIKELLHAEIKEDFDKLQYVEFGTEEYKTGVDSVVELMDRVIELDKIESDAELKRAEQKNEKRNRVIGHILTGVTTAAGIVLTVWGTKASFQFEKEGTLTTSMGRHFVNSLGKFVPKK